jgi:hypothetical protein
LACVSYSASHLGLRDDLAGENYEEALRQLGSNTKKRDHLLTLLEKAQVEHYAGQWASSNDDFELAERLALELYTRSLSTEALALISNDRSLDYRADPFEMAMIPYYRAFNYLALNQPGEAGVEARKAGEMLKDAVQTLYRRLDTDQLSKKEILETNAFLLYFSGLLHEINHQPNDAFIAYRNALMAYSREKKVLGNPVPTTLVQDLVRTGNTLGFVTEIHDLQQQFPTVFPTDQTLSGPSRERGTLAVFVETGWVPHKDEISLNLPIFTTDHFSSNDRWAESLAGRAGRHSYSTTSIRYWLNVAIPTMPPEGAGEEITGRMSLDGNAVETQIVENLDRRARLTFEATYPKILTRTIVRALIKYTASETARKEDETVGFVVNILGALTEKADTRSWLTLPGRILLLRMDLPAGDHNINLEFRDTSGTIVAGQTLTDVHIQADHWTVLNRRVF